FPTIGALAPEMPDGFVRFMPLDLKKRTAEFKPGITLDLQPFPGTLAVGIDPNDPSPRKGGVKDNPMAPVSTLRPWKNGSNEDLNKAMVNAVREAVDFLAAQKRVPLTRYEAYSLVSMVGDCRVSQVVDVRKGVHRMIPKSVFTKK